MHQFVLTNAQWAKVSRFRQADRSWPLRGEQPFVLEAVLWIARTGSAWRDLPPTFGNWNTVFKRYRDWVKAGVFRRISMPYRTIQIWSSPWSTRQSSKFTATRRAQKGNSKPGHRQVKGRLDH